MQAVRIIQQELLPKKQRCEYLQRIPMGILEPVSGGGGVSRRAVGYLPCLPPPCAPLPFLAPEPPACEDAAGVRWVRADVPDRVEMPFAADETVLCSALDAVDAEDPVDAEWALGFAVSPLPASAFVVSPLAASAFATSAFVVSPLAVSPLAALAFAVSAVFVSPLVVSGSLV